MLTQLPLSGHSLLWISTLRNPVVVPGDFAKRSLTGNRRECFFQVTLLFKHWSEFGDVIIEYGTMKSPQCKSWIL